MEKYKEKYKNCVAVITGAGSGIGRALSLELAACGAHLALSDINQSGLDETRNLLAAYGGHYQADYLDVRGRDAMWEYAKKMQAEFGRINMVVNNAGAAVNGEFVNMSLDDFEWQMDVNFWSVLYGSKAFLPYLEQAKWGHIVNISSLFGLVAAPYNSAYNASKFAVRGLSEALRIELDLAQSSVSCSSVHPGGVKTNIARSLRASHNNMFGGGKTHEEVVRGFEKAARTLPNEAAIFILKGVAKNKRRILIGSDAWIIDKIQRFWPGHYYSVMRTILGRKLE